MSKAKINSFLVNIFLFIPLCLIYFGSIALGKANFTITYGMHPVVIILIAVLILSVIYILEGSQVAILELKNQDLSSVKDKHPRAVQY